MQGNDSILNICLGFWGFLAPHLRSESVDSGDNGKSDDDSGESVDSGESGECVDSGESGNPGESGDPGESGHPGGSGTAPTLVPIWRFLVPIFFQSPHFLHFRLKNTSKVSAATI